MAQQRRVCYKKSALSKSSGEETSVPHQLQAAGSSYARRVFWKLHLAVMQV